MRLRQFAAMLAALLLAGALADNVMAQRRDRDDDRRGGRDRGDRVLLGEKSVGFRVDRDVIRINQAEDWFRTRSFRTLQFKAEGNDIHMMSIRLVYMNGFGEDIQVDQLIRRGDELPIDLRGDRSFLRQIEMTYRARPDFRGQAVIRVFGEPSRREPPPRPQPSIGQDWMLLGEQRVGFGVDRDVIRINQSEDWYRTRSFRTLHFSAEGSDIHMMAVRLVYMNGFGEDLRIDRLIREGEQLPIELRGERSFLRQVEMTYRSRPGFRGQAVIKLYGEPSRRGPPGPGFVSPGGGRDWVELGCEQVSLLGKDRDSIRVGRREGRFKSIRLHVRGADVDLIDVKVIYANGEPDDIQVRHHLREGERTRPLDLRGWERAIDRVDLVYRTALNPVDIIARQRISQATVCVEGLQ
ncbi:MAG: hypothetical protein ACKVP3_13115 [Hyphomicrobiaceae bacterium]